MTDNNSTLHSAATLELSPATILGHKPEGAGDLEKAATMLWDKIGAFPGIGEWHPAVVSCEISEVAGHARRTLSLPDGAKIIEQEESRDDAKREYVYTIVESPLPVSGYRSRFAVRVSDDDMIVVDWTGSYTADGAPDADAKGAIDGVYGGGMEGIGETAAKA